jgi:hypothetical protein
MRIRIISVCFIAILLILTIWAIPAAAQQSAADNKPDRAPGGPEGVTQKLNVAEERTSTFSTPSWAQPYYDWKKRLKKNYGLSIGLSAYWLYQKAGESLSNEDDAVGGIYRFQGSWTAFGKGTGHPGRLEWRIENRSAVGSNLSPSQLSGEIGAAALNTGFGYSDNFKTDLSVLNWTQVFADQRAGAAAGRLGFDAYLDAFMFQSFSRGFLNRAFVLNPTMGTTGIGALGAVAKGFVIDQLWVGGQIYDGNAVSGNFDFETFKEHEWLKALEVGWAPSISRYKTDRVQFTYWAKDARQKAGVPKGSGWVVSASWQVTDRGRRCRGGGRKRRQHRLRVFTGQGPGVESGSRLGQTVEKNLRPGSQRRVRFRNLLQVSALAKFLPDPGCPAFARSGQ